MKKLTMTRVLTPLAALAFTLGAQATAVSTDGFESYAAGSSVTNATGWVFTTTNGVPDPTVVDSSVVTAYGEAATPSVLPDGTTAGNNFLKLSTEDGILFRNMDGDAGESVELYQGLYVDTDVQFTLTDKNERPTPDGADKFIIWLEADEDAHSTNLCVWAREYAFVNGALDYAAGSNKVYTLDASAVDPGSWHRLTVKAIKQSHTTDVPVPGFQVYLDNTLLTSSQQQIVPDDDYNDAKDAVEAAGTPLFDLITGDLKFFPAMAGSLTALSQVGFSGEGKIDNLVVTRDLPGFEEPTTLTFTWDSSVISSVGITDLGTTLTESGSTVTVRPGTTINFTLSYQDGCSASTHTITTASSAAYATVSDFAVTAVAYGAATIAITATPKNTVDVTFNWDDLNNAMGERSIENDAISFNVGGTVYNADLDIQTSLTISGLAIGTNIEVTVSYTTQDWTTQITPDACMSLSGSTLTINSRPASGTATVNISTAIVAAPKATVNGVECATLAEAIEAAKNTAYPVVLCDDITLDAAETIAADEEVTIDLNGYTITGADDEAVFENAGTLTITDESEDHDGSVVAGTGGTVVANDGTLYLVYGYYEGDFVNTDEFEITTDCTFDNDLGRSYTAPAGYEMAETYEGSGVYQLKLLTYTITYYNGDQLLDVAPASYTVEDTVTLTNEVDLGVVGVSFQAWTNAEGTVVAGWPAGGLTGNQVFYAQTTPVVAPTTEYTITYLNSDGSTFTAWATGYTAPASFSNEVVNLPTSANIDFVLLGVQFNNWTNSEGTVVADTTGLEANLTVYANVSALVPPQGTEPGAAVTGSPFATAEEAASAASSATIALPAAVAAELTPEQQNAYKILFHAVVGEAVDGKYPVTMELTAEGAATIQSSADTAVTALAAKLTDAATAQQTVTISNAQPGFYYSIESGTEVSNLTEPQQRTLATGNTVELTMPTLGTKGFYRVKVSYEQLPPAPNN